MTRGTTLTGAAGEHYVAYRLSAMNYPVALTRDGSDTIDLLVGSISSGAAVSIQVKTSTNAWRSRRNPEKSHWEWSVGRKPLTLKDSSLIYAFVDLHENENVVSSSPDIFIVPVRDIAQQAIDAGFLDHKDWSTFYFKIYTRDKEKYKSWHLITSELDS